MPNKPSSQAADDAESNDSTPDDGDGDGDAADRGFPSKTVDLTDADAADAERDDSHLSPEMREKLEQAEAEGSARPATDSELGVDGEASVADPPTADDESDAPGEGTPDASSESAASDESPATTNQTTTPESAPDPDPADESQPMSDEPSSDAESKSDPEPERTTTESESDAESEPDTVAEAESESDDPVTGDELGLDTVSETGDFGSGEDALGAAWGEIREKTLTIKGIEVTLREPDDEDKLINAFRGVDESDDQIEVFKRAAQLAVVDIGVDGVTELTDSIWEHQMTPMVRRALGTQAIRFLGADDFIEESDDGQTLPQGV